MAFKTAMLLAILAVWGIFDVQTASISSENADLWEDDMENDSDMVTRVLHEEMNDDEYLPEYFTEDMSSDEDYSNDYYNNALNRRTRCTDAFMMCRRFRGKCDKLVRKKAFALQFCRETCQLC